MSVIEHPEGVEKLAPEVIAPSSVIGEGDERPHYREAARSPAKVALDAPKGHDILGLNSVADRDLLQKEMVLFQPGPAFLNSFLRCHQLQIFLEAQSKLRLASVQLDDAR
jgi:hypothetical protein